jgi:hypothetical protein
VKFGYFGIEFDGREELGRPLLIFIIQFRRRGEGGREGGREDGFLGGGRGGGDYNRGCIR